jgi:4-amino-4-deoxy-L-arabinose transferase-like glycosyltransferase
MRPPLDYAGFVALSLLLFATFQWATRRAGALRRIRVTGGLVVLALLVVGWPVTRSAGQKARANLIEMLMGYAPTYAAEMEVLGARRDVARHALGRPGLPAHDRGGEALAAREPVRERHLHL